MSSNEDVVPNLEWYQKRSKAMGGGPRCPFAALRRCPKYYSSVWVMGHGGGAAKIDEETDRELLKYWKQTDLWPMSSELEPRTMGPENDAHIFSNICPEVMFDRFGYFAAYLSQYADEIDREGAHNLLTRSGAVRGDWRWSWSGMHPQHYSECSMYSQLLAGVGGVGDGATEGAKRPIGF